MKIRPGHVRAAIGDFSAQRGVITTTADEGRAYYKVRPLFFFVICNYLPPNMTRRSVPLHSRSFFGFRHLAGNYLIPLFQAMGTPFFGNTASATRNMRRRPLCRPHPNSKYETHHTTPPLECSRFSLVLGVSRVDPSTSNTTNLFTNPSQRRVFALALAF